MIETVADVVSLGVLDSDTVSADEGVPDSLGVSVAVCDVVLDTLGEGEKDGVPE